MNPVLKKVITAGEVSGAIAAIVAIWMAIGGPMLATSADIHRLDRQQADTAAEVYQTKLRSLLAISPAPNTTAHQAWEEELAHTRDQIKRAEDRKIELSK